jgi:hypothetical protein
MREFLKCVFVAISPELPGKSRNDHCRPATVSSEKLGDSQRGALCAIALIVSLFLCSAVQAADSSEFWPEANVFVNLGPQTRFFGDAAWANGKESDRTSLDVAGYLDSSLKPRRKDRQTDDWQRDRLLWMRIGYDRIFNITSDAGAKVEENRGIISSYAKVLLPSGFVTEARALTCVGSAARVRAYSKAATRDRPVGVITAYWRTSAKSAC